MPQLLPPEVKPLFPTPLVITSFDDADALNEELKRLIIQRSQERPSVKKSNKGGWQSAEDFLSWSGEAGKTVIDAAIALANELTITQSQGNFAPVDFAWKVNAWANINRAGDTNHVHTHPGSYWSCCYYVHIDPAETGEVGGQFEMIDPRGVAPILYAPHLRMRVKGCLTAGQSEFHQPLAGQLLLFPAWLAHAVTPYLGGGERISVAFNLCL